MVRIKDIIVAPLVLIPYLLALLFRSSEKGRTEGLIGGSFAIAAIYFYRYFNLKEIGIILFIIGILFLFFLNPDYLNSSLSFIYVHTNPFCIRYWTLFQRKVELLFSPLIQHKFYTYISISFEILFVVVLLLLLGYTIWYLSKGHWLSYLLMIIFSTFFFVVGYKY